MVEEETATKNVPTFPIIGTRVDVDVLNHVSATTMEASCVLGKM